MTILFAPVAVETRGRASYVMPSKKMGKFLDTLISRSIVFDNLNKKRDGVTSVHKTPIYHNQSKALR